MLKKIVKVLSVAAVLATAASAAGPKCTIYNFLDQGKNYMRYITGSEFYKAFTGNYKNMSSTSKSLAMKSAIEGGIKQGIVNRIKNDLALTDMTLHLKDPYGQTFTINLQDATLNVYKYYYSHLYKKLKYANKSYRQQFIAAAIDISDFMYIISLKEYKKVKEAYIELAKTFANNGSIKSVPFLALVIIKEAANLQNLSSNPDYYNNDLEAIISGVVRGYIVAQRDRELKRYIPSEFLDFAFYTMTGNFEKADQIILKEIQRGGGFTGIMQYCLVEQLKYRNR